MNIIDNMPIIIIVIAILANIAIGVSNNIGFSLLMIRCIFVTIIFGIFGYMVTETVKNALEYSRLSKETQRKAGAALEIEENFSGNENKTTLDIKVPPLDDEELLSMDNDSDDEFVEVNPVYMGNYNEDEQD